MDIDEFDNPFRSPTPEADRGSKRPRGPDSEPEGLGIDEQVEVQKRARVPRIKLDEQRLLSEKGIPKLRKKARDLKLKGKGHEFSDAARLLSFYQLWLDDLFPKAKFLDALAMVEKAGHKTSMHKMRMEWINEGKPKTSADNEGDGYERGPSVPRETSRIAPVFETAAQGRSKTPAHAGDDLFGDDIYGATPRKNNAEGPAGGVPDDDDLDAMMAEVDAERDSKQGAASSTTKPFPSIFGDANGKKAAQPGGEPDEDDMDALMAEAEAGFGRSKPAAGGSSTGSKANGSPLDNPTNGDEPDDLDALMAEAEAEADNRLTEPAAATQKQPPQASKEQDTIVDADEEEAMAEMDGLW